MAKTTWLGGVEWPLCERCLPERELPAKYRDSIPDASVRGANMNECGYRFVFLCLVHGMERRQVATNRLEQLVGYPIED